ncbi:hypothetical protein BTA51_10750 [Hahella sp. CCB-MM4]|uniref:DUF6160 family protein n=1 Tax=Hahella sp. (strain CCB-MM4) TaxID=1926491 RepID=UPI000B9B2745|nr:DUF6160 family protein [Hahella sp. CCB-MM4]OZG73487.1 hypothetical protein BTA51_10750 [Hahella sp. CCB-MM4]
MKVLKGIVLTSAVLMANACLAELKPLEDEALGEFYGQAAPVIEMSGQVTYDAIVYTPPDGGAQEVILPGGSSTDGNVSTQQLTFQGQMFGMPQTGGVVDSLFSIFPMRMGGVDTNDDGTIDRGAMMFSFQPNVGRGTQFSPLDITLDDDTVNVHDQLFISNQGILILNAPLENNTFTIPGQSGEFSLTPVKYF